MKQWQVRLQKSRSYKWWVLAVIMVGTFMAVLDVTVVNVGLPTIMNVFHIGLSTAEWVVTAYMITMTIMLPTAGWLADRYGNTVYLGERDCSLQRRNQKLIEEAPARCLTPELRARMGEAAVRAARAVGYEGAGTVEFLLDADMEHFYFMEMNTRIQVEHGITELVTGVDLVRQQLRIASGLALDMGEVTLQGHALECRINAEDPAADFRPCPGKVGFLHFPGGPGVRVDSHLYTGYTLPPYYDSLAAKLMVHAPTRLEAIRKMRRCLEEFALDGFRTNAELSYQILYHPTFVRGGCTTAFLDQCLPQLLDFSRHLPDQEET